MPDLAKVIKGLECCYGDDLIPASNECGWTDGDYPECPYNDHVDGCCRRLMRDALALLKGENDL